MLRVRSPSHRGIAVLTDVVSSNMSGPLLCERIFTVKPFKVARGFDATLSTEVNFDSGNLMV